MIDVNDMAARRAYIASQKVPYLTEKKMEKFGKFYGMSGNHLIYKDLDEIEEGINELINELGLEIYQQTPQGRLKVVSVKLVSDVTEEGFIIPSTVQANFNSN